jgi:hypothetical protein
MDEFNLYSQKDAPELLAILRQGYKRGGKVIRCEKVGPQWDVFDYDVFCPIALAGLTINDDQLLDRSIAINMLRSNNVNISSSEIDEVWFNKIKLTTWESITKFMGEYSFREIENSYNKLLECVFLSGRDRELWFPLLTVAHYLKEKEGYNIWDDVVGYSYDYIKEKEEEDLTTLDSRILQELSKLESLQKFTSSEVAGIMNEGLTNIREQITAHSIGHALKRLGIPFKNHSGKRYYNLTQERYNALCQKFDINLDINHEA